MMMTNFDGGRAMDKEKLNQFLDFIENDLGIKFFVFQKEFFRTTLGSQEVYFFPGFPRGVGMKEFDASRAFDENNNAEDFLENPESPKS